MRRARGWVLSLVAIVCAVACSATGAAVTPAPASTQPPASVAPVPGNVSQPDPNTQPAAQAAVEDAATHLGVTPNQLQVVQVEERQWPDSSLGCPKPGLMYSQIVTPGFLIVIMGPAGKRLEYHTDSRATVVLCSES